MQGVTLLSDLSVGMEIHCCRFSAKQFYKKKNTFLKWVNRTSVKDWNQSQEQMHTLVMSLFLGCEPFLSTVTDRQRKWTAQIFQLLLQMGNPALCVYRVGVSSHSNWNAFVIYHFQFYESGRKMYSPVGKKPWLKCRAILLCCACCTICHCN